MGQPKQTDRTELLAPAGDWDALRAAVANGADAVYLGLGNFNARHRATNFAADDLPRVIAYLRQHNVRAYITFNTLIFSEELEQAAEQARAIAAAGADAIIVQDLGLARLIHRMFPRLPLHASTQATLTEPRGIEFVRALGIGRVILARELTIDQIGQIAHATGMPLEVFIHGALCVAYSGQCLTSEALGGRSANRGQCAQACRLPYDLIVDGRPRDLGERAYLLSPQDLAAPELVADLVRLRISGLKIEGRLKSAHYVAAATQTYRAALDAALAGRPFGPSPQQRQDLAQSFSRGFTHGFLAGIDHQGLVHGRFPKSRGLRVGRVLERTGRGLLVELASASVTVHPGDGIVFDEGHPEQDEQGGRILAVEPRGGRVAELLFRREDVSLAAVAEGSLVWKTDDPAIRRRLEQSFARDRVARRIGLWARVIATGTLRIELRDDIGRTGAAEWPQPLQPAQKHPLTTELLREQLGRLGQTPFELRGVELIGPDGPAASVPLMVPKSVLNELRRQAVESLIEQRRQDVHYELADPDALAELQRQAAALAAPEPSPAARLTALARSMDQLQAALQWQPGPGQERPHTVYCEFEDVRRYAEAIAAGRERGMAIGLATLRILKPGEEGLLRQIADCRPDCILVRNLGALAFFREQAPDIPLVGDYALNVANELTAALLIESGLHRLTPSYDLNWQQLAAMLQRIPAGRFEPVIHQHMPMFHMEHCVFCATLSNGHDHRDCGRPCEKHQADLRDRQGVPHPLLADIGCRNTVYNGTAQSGAEYVSAMRKLGCGLFRVELLRQDAAASAALLTHYARIVAGQDDGRATWRRLRVLNQLGVTRGTLAAE